MKPIIFALFALSLTIAAPAWSQETPYSPKKASIGQLIQLASYQESPIQLPFEETNRQTVVNGKRVDFEHTYAILYAELLDFFVEAYKKQTPISALRPETVPHIKDPTLFVLGISPGGDRARFTLGSKEIPIRFTIDIVPDGDHSIVVVRNAIYSQLFSGIMPARAGYKPTDSNPIGFRWN